MKNQKTIFLLMLITAFFASCFSFDYSDSENKSTEIINLNPDPNGEPWLAGGLIEPSEEELESMPRLSSIIKENAVRAALPSSVDNSTKKYFRGIFGQSGGSCAQASSIGYVYTYEMNRLKNTDATQLANQFPAGYTYNFLNGGSGSNGSWIASGWSIIDSNGIPTSDTYGGTLGGNQYKAFDSNSKANFTYWMSGYDEYYSGLVNRIDTNFTIEVGTVSGLNSLKAYLAHHGTGSSDGGIVAFAAGASSGQKIPSGTYMDKKYIHLWETKVNHAMTLVGYDDNVLIDYNGDGQYTNNIDINNDKIVDLKDYEKGALIVANSWNTKWANNGFIYMPYRLCALPSNEGGIGSNKVYGIKPKKVETPDLLMKVRIKHNRRDFLHIKIGVNENTSSATYSDAISEQMFEYRPGEFSMLGQSAPDVMNNDPITIAFDCTELLKKTNPTLKSKYFLEITENDSSGIGAGAIEYASLLDYRSGTAKETIITSSSKTILNNTKTLLSTVLAAPVTSYIITATSGANGTITPSGNLTVNQGASKTFTIAPDSGYAINAVTVDGANAGAVPSYTFSNVGGNHSISASFKSQPPAGPEGYTWCAPEGGRFELPGICDVAYGANGQFYYKFGKSGTIIFNNATFGDPCPGVVKAGFYKATSISTRGINYEYYEGNWSALPDFDSLTPKKTGVVSNFDDLSKRDVDDLFGFRFSGYIKIVTSGDYTFYTSSDDGSKLSIDGSVVVNNGGIHANIERSGQIYLRSGLHEIQVTYFERYSAEILNVAWQGPGFEKKPIPDRVLYQKTTRSTGLIAEYYEGSWSEMPDFDALTPIRSSTETSFSIANRDTDDFFAFRFSGYINIPSDGVYHFYTTSDDGSLLIIDDAVVVNNDGIHPAEKKAGSRTLTAGYHKIEVMFFEYAGGEVLDVAWSGPGFGEQTIPASALIK